MFTMNLNTIFQKLKFNVMPTQHLYCLSYSPKECSNREIYKGLFMQVMLRNSSSRNDGQMMQLVNVIVPYHHTVATNEM